MNTRRFMAKYPSMDELDRRLDSIESTLDLHGLNPKYTLLLGGSALNAAGIRLANDVDIMVASGVYDQMALAGTSPAGYQLEAKHLPRQSSTYWLQTIDPLSQSEYLHVDITRPTISGIAMPDNDEHFARTIETLPTIRDEGVWRYLTPEHILKILENTQRPRPAKTRNDIRAIRSRRTS